MESRIQIWWNLATSEILLHTLFQGPYIYLMSLNGVKFGYYARDKSASKPLLSYTTLKC